MAGASGPDSLGGRPCLRLVDIAAPAIASVSLGRRPRWPLVALAAPAIASVTLGGRPSLPLVTLAALAVLGAAVAPRPPLCSVDAASGVVRGPNASAAGVRVFPLLPRATCAALVAAAEGAAETRGGWRERTDRHAEYATTDLEVRSVPALWKLAEPHLQKAVVEAAEARPDGCSRSLDFHDLFLVRYAADVPGAQRALAAHEDGSQMTLQVSLNSAGEDFDGGGTYFHSLGCRLQQAVGEAVVFPGYLRHAGVEISSGRRYVLVGFSRRASADEGETDDEHVLPFGPAYNVSLDPPPCLGPEGEGSPLFVEVSWFGCAEDPFELRRDTRGDGDAPWLWWERGPPAACRSAAPPAPQHRALFVESGLPQAGTTGPAAFMALPPGHVFAAYGLRPCAAAVAKADDPRARFDL